MQKTFQIQMYVKFRYFDHL